MATNYTLAQLKAAKAARTVVTLTAGFPGHVDSILAREDTTPTNRVYDVKMTDGCMRWTCKYRVAANYHSTQSRLVV